MWIFDRSDKRKAISASPDCPTEKQIKDAEHECCGGKPGEDLVLNVGA